MTVSTLQDREPTRMSRLARRFPLTFFLTLVIGLSYPLMSLVAMAEYGVIPGRSFARFTGGDMERVASILLVGSLVAATFVTTASLGGRPAVQVLVRRMLRWRVPLVWWVVAVVVLPASTVLLSALLGDTVRTPSGGVLAREVVSVAIALLLINLWEEAAWAGFLQSRLERRHSFFVAAALTGVGFAAVHVPLRIISHSATTPRTVGLAFLTLLVFSVIFRTVMGMVLRGAANSILVVAATHTLFNRSNNADGIAADILVGDNRPIAALLATVLVAVLLGVCLHGKLRRSYRRALDEAEEDVPAPLPEQVAVQKG